MPVVLHLNGTQTMELIREGGLKVELTDDQAIHVASQLGELLKTKVHHAESNHKAPRKYRFRRIKNRNGAPTLSSKVYDKLTSLPVGKEFKATDIIAELDIAEGKQNAVYASLHRLVTAKRVKRINKGEYRIL